MDTFEIKTRNPFENSRHEPAYQCVVCGRPQVDYHSSGRYVRIIAIKDAKGEPSTSGIKTGGSIVLKLVTDTEWSSEMDCIGSSCARKIPARFKFKY